MTKKPLASLGGKFAGPILAGCTRNEFELMFKQGNVQSIFLSRLEVRSQWSSGYQSNSIDYVTPHYYKRQQLT